MDWADVEFGNLADWAAAVFTGAAFLIGWLVLKHEQDARKANEQEAAKLHARSIAVEARMYGKEAVIVDVRNSGVAPVHNVLARIYYMVDGKEAAGPIRVNFGVLVPNHPKNSRQPLDPPGTHYSVTNSEVLFMDVNGHYWTKTQQGVLTETTPPT